MLRSCTGNALSSRARAKAAGRKKITHHCQPYLRGKSWKVSILFVRNWGSAVYRLMERPLTLDLIGLMRNVCRGLHVAMNSDEAPGQQHGNSLAEEQGICGRKEAARQ